MQSRTWLIGTLSIGIRPPLLGKAKERTLIRPEEALAPERFQIAIAGDFISERWAISFRNRERFEIGTLGDFPRNQQLLSAAGNSYNRDYFGETVEGSLQPMLSSIVMAR
jgi:hypothetical protein